MIDGTSVADLGDNTSDLLIEDSVAPAPPAPPPPPREEKVMFAMSPDEKFTRQQYHDAGWSDEQLLAVGKMISVTSAQIMTSPVGMPNSTWIMLDDNDDIPPTGLFLGHNGTGYMIQTGVPVCVPNHILGVLDDAIMSAPIIDPKTRQIMGYRDRPRYTYRKVDAPVAAS
jgi:hypothetical protein